MILSVSRRTDIPNYYSDWFYNRIKEGFLYVRNPMNPHQISRITVLPETVDCIVFWTKNPEPMLGRLGELAAYPFYFQFTLTGYGRGIEPGIPHKREEMIPVFRRLSEQIGKKRVIWRYDPIFFSDTYTEAYHLQAFGQIASMLRGSTEKCVISFLDVYRRNQKAMQQLGVKTFCFEDQGRPDRDAKEGITSDKIKEFAGRLYDIAASNDMGIASCAEEIDLSECGIAHNSCIDQTLIESITGYPLKVGKDKNQRAACGCVESIEVGTYHTCLNGCKYCYANDSHTRVKRNYCAYDVDSPLLCGKVESGDRITERKEKRLRAGQP